MRGGSGEGGSASAARRPGRGSGAKRKRLSAARSSGSGEEAARSPASRRPRQTPREIVARSQPDVRHLQPGARATGQAGGMAVQQIAGEADQSSALSTSSGVSLSPPAPPSPPPRRFAVGDLVMVDNRTWPGMNKYGGVAFVCAVLDPPGSFYDVKYSLTRKIERGVEARFVHPYAFMDDGVGNRSRRNSRNRDTRRSSSRVAKANGAASGSTPEKEVAAADNHITTTSASAGDATLTASPLRTPSPCRVAGERGLSPAAVPTSLQTQPNRDALEEKKVFKGEYTNETTGGSVTEKGSGSATSMAVISRVGRDNADDARLERRHDTGEDEKTGKKVKAPGCEERQSSGAAQSDDSVVTLPGASVERVNGTSKSRLGRRCDTVGEAKDHIRQEAPLQSNGSASVERGNDSDTTLIFASGGEEEESSDDDDDELQPCDSEANGDHSPSEGTVGNTDREVNEERRLWRGSEVFSSVERHQKEHSRVLEAGLRDSRHAGGEQGREVTSAYSRQPSQQNRTFGAIVPDNGQTEKSRRAGPPQLAREDSSDNATPGPDKDVGTTQDVGPLSPTTRLTMNDPRPSAVGLESPFSPRSAGPSTRKVDDSITRESQADRDAHVERDQSTGGVTSNSLEKVLGSQSRPPAEKGKGDPPLRATYQSFASTAHGAPNPSAEQSLQVIAPPPSLASPSPKRPSYRVGDLVDVLSRSSPGVNKEGGVARVTRANTDGTYNVKYCVRQGTEKAVDAAIMSPYALSGECDSGGDHGDDDGSGGKREGKGRAVVPSLSPVGVSVRRTHRRGSCPPDAAAGQANAACLNLILGDTQYPELALDPDLIHALGSETPRLGSGETVGETKSGSACVSDSTGATVCGEEEDGDKGGKVQRCDAKGKTENDKGTVASKQGVRSKKTRAGGTRRRPSSRKGASTVVSSGERRGNAVETAPSDTRRGQGSPVVLTLSSLTSEMIDVAESLAVR